MPDNSQLSVSKIYFFFFALMLAGIYAQVYLIDSRKEIVVIGFSFLVLFGSYYLIIKKYALNEYYQLNFVLSIALRLLPIVSLPLLSDDFYRFIWDGQLTGQGINPFSFNPKQIMEMGLPLNKTPDLLLYQKMNSPEYFTVYPPVNQFIFWLSSLSGKGNLWLSVIILRTCIVLFDIGNLIIIKKLLLFKNLNKNLLFIYALNPLVIIEFSGNLHFEAAMIFFTLLSILFIYKTKWKLSAFSLALGVCSKLLPVLFIPLIIKEIGFKKTIYYGLIVTVCCLLLFSPFIHSQQLITNFLTSIKLYYGKFEFNGGIYQLFKWAGWEYYGYNPIVYTSKIILLLSISGYIITYIKSKNIFEGIFWLLFIYTVFGAIVHPWYILPLLALSPFLKWRFAVVWSLLICLSYYTYRVYPYQENLDLVLVEYVILFAYLGYEVVRFYSDKRKVSVLRR